jgi:hypothetical protein
MRGRKGLHEQQRTHGIDSDQLKKEIDRGP